MNICIEPKTLSGCWNAPPSKSHCHRLLFASALSGTLSQAWSAIAFPSQDLVATKSCLDILSPMLPVNKRGASLSTSKNISPCPIFDCGESGTTLRLLLPLAMTLCDEAIFVLHGRLGDRPLEPLKSQMIGHGCSFSYISSLPKGLAPSTLRSKNKSEHAPIYLKVSGYMSGGDFSLAGNVSSQFISALLFALPLHASGGSIQVSSPLESAPYVNMTLACLDNFAIQVTFDMAENRFDIPGTQDYTCRHSLIPEGDWSTAAFFLVANALGSNVVCQGLSSDSLQGDRAVLDIISAFGNKSTFFSTREVNVSQIPDLLPILAVLSSCSHGKTIFSAAGRLRLKESDRIGATCHNLKTLGVALEEYDDTIIISGGNIKGGIVQGFNDHRIVMSMAIAATISQKPITILGAEAVTKSYPSFFEDFRTLGGLAHEV